MSACLKHSEKNVEYFCKQCSQDVCVKCMFEEHNGHHLVLVEDKDKEMSIVPSVAVVP